MSRILQTKKAEITQHYGNNGHTGVDVVGQGRTIDNVIAHSEGDIIWSQTGQVHNPGSTNNASYGNACKIKHKNGYYTLYAHMDRTTFWNGKHVEKGEVLGRMGNTGNSAGAHLHFEVFNQNNQRVNPEQFIENDLPNLSTANYEPNFTGTIVYQAYIGYWLPKVSKVDNTEDGYAGYNNQSISAIKCKPQYGEILYKVRLLNGDWLEEVSSKNFDDIGNGESFAGFLGSPIDEVKMRCTRGYIEYRVKTVEDGWLDWVTNFDTYTDEYAGISGHKIIGIQMK